MFQSRRRKRETDNLLNQLRANLGLNNPPTPNQSDENLIDLAPPDYSRDNTATPPHLYPIINVENNPFYTIDEVGGSPASPPRNTPPPTIPENTRISTLERMLNDIQSKVRVLSSKRTPSPARSENAGASPMLGKRPLTSTVNENFQSQSNSHENVPNSRPLNMNFLSQSATVALTNIQQFSGEKDSKRQFNEFKRELLCFFELYVQKTDEISDSHFSAFKTLCLQTRLNGTALNFVQNLKKEQKSDFTALIKALDDRFNTPLNISLIRNELTSLVQEDSMTVNELHERICSLVRKYIRADRYLSSCPLDQQESAAETLRLQTLHTSLNKDIFSELTRLNKFGDFETMISNAKEVEMNLKIVKARLEGSKAQRIVKLFTNEAEGNSPKHTNFANTRPNLPPNRQFYQTRPRNFDRFRQPFYHPTPRWRPCQPPNRLPFPRFPGFGGRPPPS